MALGLTGSGIEPVSIFFSRVSASESSTNSPSNVAVDKDTHEAADHHSPAVAVVIGVFVALFVFCFLCFVLRYPRGRIAAKRAAKKVLCMTGSGSPAYRYIRVSDSPTLIEDRKEKLAEILLPKPRCT